MSEHRHVIMLEVEDKPGVLARISTLFSRRGFNVESLAVGHTHKKGISRFTIVVMGDDRVVEQIKKQSQKLVQVIKAEDLRREDSIMREFAIVKIDYNETDAPDINELIDLYGGRMLDSVQGQLVVEFSGTEHKINKIFNELQRFTLLESIRTGKIGMQKG